MPCPFLLRIYVGTGGSHTHRDYAFLPLAMFHHERAQLACWRRAVSPLQSCVRSGGCAIPLVQLAYSMPQYQRQYSHVLGMQCLKHAAWPLPVDAMQSGNPVYI